MAWFFRGYSRRSFRTSRGQPNQRLAGICFRTMFRRRLIILSVSLLLLRPQAASSPKDSSLADEQTFAWASAAIGGGTMFTTGGITGRVAISYQYGKEVFTFRTFTIRESDVSFGEARFPYPEETETDFALLYGWGSNPHSPSPAFSIGVGVVRSQHRGQQLRPPYGLEYELLKTTSLGIAFDMQAFFRPLPFFGLGFSLAGNLNPSRAFVGFLLSINLGYI